MDSADFYMYVCLYVCAFMIIIKRSHKFGREEERDMGGVGGVTGRDENKGNVVLMYEVF